MFDFMDLFVVMFVCKFISGLAIIGFTCVFEVLWLLTGEENSFVYPAKISRVIKNNFEFLVDKYHFL